jgi:hypothetical protein
MFVYVLIWSMVLSAHDYPAETFQGVFESSEACEAAKDWHTARALRDFPADHWECRKAEVLKHW